MTFDSDKPLIGQEMSNDKWILSFGKAIVVNGDRIEDIQDSKEALDDYESHSTNSKQLQLIDVNGKAVTYKGDDLTGRVLQHELDHLNGKLLIASLKRKERKAALKEISLKGFPGDHV